MQILVIHATTIYVTAISLDENTNENDMSYFMGGIH